MKIAGIGASFPTLKIDNERVVDKLKTESFDRCNYSIDEYSDKIVEKLDDIGIQNRYWLDKNESYLDLINDAVQKALDDAGLKKTDIDLLIYSSVFKQFAEPGDSFFIAKMLGFTNAQCFDVLEACNSFIRASNIADAYLKSEKYKNVMVITCEFFTHRAEFNSSFQMEAPQDLQYLFSSLTIGEGTSATIFSNDEKTWAQNIVGLPESANACYLPINNITDYEKEMFGLKTQDARLNRFVSYSLELHKAGYHTLKGMILDSINEQGLAEIVFPHTHSINVWNKFASSSKIEVPYYHIFPEYGNLITGSFPSAIYLAKKEGKLKRGMKAGAWMAAAGMSLSITSFEF